RVPGVEVVRRAVVRLCIFCTKYGPYSPCSVTILPARRCPYYLSRKSGRDSRPTTAERHSGRGSGVSKPIRMALLVVGILGIFLAFAAGVAAQAPAPPAGGTPAQPAPAATPVTAADALQVANH